MRVFLLTFCLLSLPGKTILPLPRCFPKALQMKTKLDARTVAAFTTLPGDKSEDFYWDDQLDRFGLRLRRGAGDRLLRSWIVQYRRAGATRRMTIGSADVLSPDQARTAARKVLAKVDLGEDPQHDRGARRDKDKLSFRNVVAEYVEAKREEVRPTTFRHITGYLARGSYFKALHGMPVDRIGVPTLPPNWSGSRARTASLRPGRRAACCQLSSPGACAWA